jgi:hypothetical protein
MSTRNRQKCDSEIKMFLSQSEIDEVMKKDDNATAYIIQQNSVLVQRNMDLIQKCNELENEKEELESFNDRLEKTRTCLQGYVRNEHDMVIKYKKLYEYQNNTFNVYHREFIYTQSIPIIMFILTLFGKYLYNINYMFLVTVNVLFMSFHCLIIYSTYIYLHKIRNTREIKEILEDIVKTKQSNSYIDDLIDNM